MKRRLGEDDVGTTGKRAIDETDSMGGEQVLGSRAERGFGSSSVPRNMWPEITATLEAEGVGAHVKIGVGQGFQ